MHRLANRRICRNCKRVFHTTSAPPLNFGLCDGCGEALIQREDDTPEAIDIRMEEYHAQTLPLAEFYRSQKKLLEVSGFGSVQTVLRRILHCLEDAQPAETFVNRPQAGHTNPGWSFKERHV
jgi:adenylate kinase